MPDRSCSVLECERPWTCKGLCDPHYRRWRKFGDAGLLTPIVPRSTGTPEQRFWPKVDKHGPIPVHRPDLGPCWLFTAEAETPNGYPQFRCGPRMVLAYRFAYELMVGPIPEGLDLDHLCRVRKCVRPSHLEPVPLAVNNARTRGHRYRPTCSKGHEMTPENTSWYGPEKRKRGCRICGRAKWNRWNAKRQIRHQ